MTSNDFLDILSEIFRDRVWPKPLHRVQGALLVARGSTIQDAAAEVGTNSRSLTSTLESGNVLTFELGLPIQNVDDAARDRAVNSLGQLLVGRAAEHAFEDIYREEMHSSELELRDLRVGRTATDYRIYDGRGRPIYRVNIKFHGALFRRATDLVGLEPEDCFALATYKIHGALKKQEEEALPYLFAIVGVRTLSGEMVGQKIPDRYVDAMAYAYAAPKSKGIRDFEDAIVEELVRLKVPAFADTYEEIKNSDWYILSARRANMLVKQLLFERIYALRIRGFAQQFRAAELDMHFSLRQDLTPLLDFLHVLEEEGHPKVVTKIERGDY